MAFFAESETFAESVTTASVSCTGRSAAAGADTAATGADMAGVLVSGDIAAAGVGTVFCRVAKYPPAAADAIHASASAANASRFEDIRKLLGTHADERQAAYLTTDSASPSKSAEKHSLSKQLTSGDCPFQMNVSWTESSQTK